MSGRAVHLGVAAGVAVASAYFVYQAFFAKKKEAASSVLQLPEIDFGLFLNRNKDANSKKLYIAECKRAAEALHEYGVCVVRDPRVDQKDNSTFIDMMEKYFSISDWVRDARPQWHYQVHKHIPHIYIQDLFSPFSDIFSCLVRTL